MYTNLIKLTSLLLVTNTLASTIKYTTHYSRGGANDGKGGTQTLAGAVPQAKDNLVLQHVANWTDHAFEARKHPVLRDQILVERVENVLDRSEADHENEEVRKLVNKKVGMHVRQKRGDDIEPEGDEVEELEERDFEEDEDEELEKRDVEEDELEERDVEEDDESEIEERDVDEDEEPEIEERDVDEDDEGDN